MDTLLGGRYAIERRIGEGGMAEVLLARDLAEDGRPVVVKRCRAHLKHQPEFAHLFLREARLASLVHHPNVVSLEATGDDEGQPYLVMEYLQGFTVRDVFFRAATEGGIPQDIAAAIILGAARGLSAAHTAVDERGKPIGLVHRDVSPHNLFLTDHGVVKVLDFGIAKGASDVTMTRAGHVKGKASYLSPEQLVSGGPVDQRADLFSLGIIAWELFTGARLFKRASETDTIMAIRSLNVDSPTKLRPELDAEYARVVMRQLARSPDDRPRDAATIAMALERGLRRRMPSLVGPNGDAELAKYVAHIRQVAPVDEAPQSIPSLADPPLDKAAKKKAFEEAWGSAPNLAAAAPAKVGEEATATLAPPVEGAWSREDAAPSGMSATGSPAPVDGSVVGTWAVAGAQRPGVDNSGGYAVLDPSDLVEASKSGLLPLGAVDAPPVNEDAETSVWPGAGSGNGVPGDEDAFSTKPLAARQAPVPPSVPPPSTEPRRGYPASIERILGNYPRLEKLVHAQPPPQLVIAILAGALVAGVIVSYVIASIV